MAEKKLTDKEKCKLTGGRWYKGACVKGGEPKKKAIDKLKVKLKF